MPEETMNVQSALESLEDYNQDFPKTRLQNYKIIQNALEKDEDLSADEVKRLLTVCVHDTPLMKYTPTVINTISALLSKLKAGRYDPPPDLVPSAAAVISVLKTIALLSKVESLITLCLDAVFSYPEDTLVTLTEHHCQDVLEIFNLCCHTRIPMHIRLQACNLLHKLLKIMPCEMKKEFIEKGVSVWFSKVIPTVMSHMSVVGSNTDIYIQILELLTDDLIHVDYTSNSPWYNILECICIAKQYPAMMKALLHAGNDAWCRLWIIFIRLLKHQITQSLSSVGTPINSMLPVVEAAFKLDINNRCKAFECWNVLIDSFSTETNESNINKRIKLLIIPLKSNNAKTEETAIAKFKCWWHLIRKFQNKMDKFLEIVLVSFLHFCFGRHNAVDKSMIVPGQISTCVKKYCNEALVDMIGHVNCDGCTNLPKLKGKIITTKHLVDNWNHWIYSLTSVIMRTAKNDCGLTRKQMKCLWTSFLMTIGDLPQNNIRKDLFAEILSILTHLVQECKSNNEFLDITFNILILSLFEGNTKIKQLFKSDNNPNDPINRIVMIIMDSSLYGFYKSLQAKELLTKFKQLTNLMLDEEVCNPINSISMAITDLPVNDYGLLLWSALAESIYESEYHCDALTVSKMIMWPIKSICRFTKLKVAAMTWYTTYDLLYLKTNTTNIEKEVSDILVTIIDTPETTEFVYFKLCVVLAVLKHKFTENNCMACEKEINLLLLLTKGINSYEYFEPLMPMLVDRIVAIMSIVTTNVNDTVTALILVCVKNVLHILTQTCKQRSEPESNIPHILLLIANLLKPLELLFVVESYSKLIPAMTYHLLRCSPLLSEHSSTQTILLSVMKSILSNIETTDDNYDKVKKFIDDIENIKLESSVRDSDHISENKEFTTPQAKEVIKQPKKKEVSIVNTVVENGEEYVVVKSNWKFNPRKLTENQKERLQRKREDIPALYQDLSQSQDEFRLASWKTDSQDTTSSSKSTSKSSKPGSNESAAEILKNLPSTNVVPKILETILSENDKKVTSIKDLSSKDNASKLDASTPATKNAQSPRMALKDRVFRNMRNLMESSGLQKENKDSTEDRNKNDNYSRTPPSTKNSITNLVNSAPCLLAERPSRVKRKPKKFEDLELLTAKKRRNSLPDTQTDKVEQSKHVTAPKSNQNVDTIVTADIEMEDDVNESINLGNIANSDISYNEQNMVSENNDITVEITDDEVNKSPMKNASSQLVSVFNDDAKTDLPNASSIDTKSKDVMEVTITKTPAKVGRLSTPKSSRNENQMIISSNGEQTLATNTSVDVKDVSTPKSSKVVQEVSTLIASKLFMPQSGDVEQMSSPKACNMKQGSTIKVLEANKEKSSLNATKDNNEVSTPKISEDIKNLPETSINVSEDSAPTRNNEIVELATSTVSKDIKDVSTPAASKIFKEISTPTASKNVKEVSTPTASKNIKEVATPTASMNIKEVATPTVSKNIKEVSTPTASQNIKEVSTSTTSKNFKEISTPTASKNVKEVSTPTASKNIKEVSTPTASKRIKDGTTPQPSKQISKPLSTKNIKEHSTLDENKELTTPKQTKESKDVITPKQSHKVDEQKSTTKKSTIKKSRIEKELAIDTVEGHPFLKIQSGKRLTRKALETVNSGRRKSLANKLNKSKVEGAQKIDKKSKDKNKETENTSTSSVIVDESQEQNSEQTSVSDELPDSDDIIESSQDSTMTTISVKSRRKTPVKLPVVCVKKWTKSLKKVDTNNSQSILDCVKLDAKSTSGNAESKDDSVLPLNKTALVENSQDDLTENMDTEPLDDVNTSEDVILVNSDVPVVTLASEVPTVGPESQELAEADTQPTDPKQFMEIDDIHETSELSLAKVTGNHIAETCSEKHDSPRVDKDEIAVDKTMDGTVDNTTLTLSDSAFGDRESASSASSPFKDEAQRQKDFLNNTVEISPIKIMSPDRNKKSPSPETSNDFVVIKLSSPVQSNGEPFENGGSPEVFTEEKVSPDKRDQSPPRGEVTVTNTSPNSSLSLKKNRPQVRSGGRAAQMLGLCVPEKIQAIVNPERSEPEDVKKSSTNTPARRNLRILYNSVGENTESSNGISENDDSDNFLKFRRSLPAVDCSPSGPILKRKLAEITDDAMVSPASKRKRVSFHDPPVSTTISVQKYIEPGVLRSPQNSAHKRLERQLRQYTPQKSPKRLDNVFKLDTVLTKTVASFTEGEDIIIIPDDTQAISLDITPIVEVVRTSELNNTDPICPDLLGCNDPIENIASELSSPAMKSLLIKELEGTIETIGDLAKLTELEVNRLCIKAPKVTVAKKVLSDYAAKKAENLTIETEFAQSMSELEKKTRNIEIQTDINKSIDVEMQTENIPTTVFAAQTESVSTAHCSAQTKESGCKSSTDIIKSCLSEKPDFVAALGECLEEPSIQHLSEKLLLSTVTDLLMKKITPSDTLVVLDRLLEKETNSSSDNTKGLSFIRDYVCDKFETKDLLLLCSQILKIVYDKPA